MARFRSKYQRAPPWPAVLAHRQPRRPIMTMLKDRMMQDLKLAGHALKTQKTYLECIGLFAQFCWSPEQADQAQVRAWVEKLQKSQVGSQRLRQHFAALKFLYGKTLARPEQ